MTELTVASLEAIALADDLTAVRAVEYIYERVGSVEADADDSQLEVPQNPTLQALLASIGRDEQYLLDQAESIGAARWILCQFSKTTNGPVLVLDALKNWRDTSQGVGERLQWALVGTLLLCVATTEVVIDSNGIQLHKKAIAPALIETTATFLKGKISVKVLDRESAETGQQKRLKE